MTLHDDAREIAEQTEAAATPEPTPRPPMSPKAIDKRIHQLAQTIRLSIRERLVLRYIALGYPYRHIAEAMLISPRTVKMHAGNLRRKLQGRTRWDLVRRVIGA
jgi:DNA-binding CsgD family transcriptional regulator